MTVQQRLERYFATLSDALRRVAVTDRAGAGQTLEQGCEWMRGAARAAHDSGNKLMFIGNGGSAGIAGHLAIDFSKNGNLRALAFNDPMALTCVGNDLGYHNVFAKQVEMHRASGDLLVAISSSGKSPNILAAVAARARATARLRPVRASRPTTICGGSATSTSTCRRANTALSRSATSRSATRCSTWTAGWGA